MAITKGFEVVAALMLYSVLFHYCVVHAKPPTVYTVGDGFGWAPTTDIQAWARGKTFYAGDILVFKYDYQSYDLVVDDQEGHDSCTVSENSTTYESGNDRIQLPYGNSYFICSVPEVCQAGMKLAVFGNAPPPPLK